MSVLSGTGFRDQVAPCPVSVPFVIFNVDSGMSGITIFAVKHIGDMWVIEVLVPDRSE